MAKSFGDVAASMRAFTAADLVPASTSYVHDGRVMCKVLSDGSVQIDWSVVELCATLNHDGNMTFGEHTVWIIARMLLSARNGTWKPTN